jgi:hypothetical protein
MTLSPHYELIGKTFGDLTIIALDATRTGADGYWMVARCGCGNTRTVYSPRFERGEHRACVACEKWSGAQEHSGGDEAA